MTAAALALGEKNKLTGDVEYKVKSQGGDLSVKFTRADSKFTNIWLIGPAVAVFKGEVNV